MFGKNKKEKKASKRKVEAGQESAKASSKMSHTSEAKNSSKDCSR